MHLSTKGGSLEGKICKEKGDKQHPPPLFALLCRKNLPLAPMGFFVGRKILRFLPPPPLREKHFSPPPFLKKEVFSPQLQLGGPPPPPSHEFPNSTEVVQRPQKTMPALLRRKSIKDSPPLRKSVIVALSPGEEAQKNAIPSSSLLSPKCF